jgi:hypothetical protein
MPIGGGGRFRRNRDNQPLTSLLPVEPTAQQPTAQARGGRSRFGRGGGRRRGREPVQDLGIGDRIEPFGLGGGNDPMEASGLGFQADVARPTQPNPYGGVPYIAPVQGLNVAPQIGSDLSGFGFGGDTGTQSWGTGASYWPALLAQGGSALDQAIFEMTGLSGPQAAGVKDILRDLYEQNPPGIPSGPPSGPPGGDRGFPPPRPGRPYDPNPRGPSPPGGGGWGFQFPVLRF